MLSFPIFFLNSGHFLNFIQLDSSTIDTFLIWENRSMQGNNARKVNSEVYALFVLSSWVAEK